MKKFLKSLVVALVMIPCALMFTACGQLSDVKVNTKGNYKEADVKTLTTFAEENKDVKSMEGGYKYTVSVSYGDKASIESTAIAQLKDGKLVGFAMNYEAKGTVDDKDLTATMEGYAHDGKAYYHYKDSKNEYKYQQEVADLEIDSSVITDLIDPADIANLQTVLGQVSSAAKVSVAKSGKTTKFHIEMEGNELYYVFKEGKLVGAQCTMTIDLSKLGGSVVTVKMNLVEFNGNIKYPSGLDKYSTEVPKDLKF